MLTFFRGRHVLLLQGPMGPFFSRLRKDLEEAGARVSKINLCAGDALFFPLGATPYRGSLADWPEFLGNAIETKGIDTLVLFGDCRPYHCVARAIAARKGCELVVFEEGYLRPDCITIERGGVNNYSSMPREPAAYSASGTNRRIEEGKVVPVGNTFPMAGAFATCYSIANHLGAWLYPRYQHHRPLNPFMEAFQWLRGLVRKYRFMAQEAHLMAELAGPYRGRYFLVPLQVHNDAQITIHSEFASIEKFIDHVVASFAANAPVAAALVIKHHPMDRPYRDYTKLVRLLARRHGLDGRLFYVHDLHLPTLLDHACGTVVVNSTVGLSSILHNTPVISLGNPVYNMKGLCFQGSIDEFWNGPGQIDSDLHDRFRAWLLAHNQANGSFYRRVAGAGNHCGVVWPASFAEKWRGLAPESRQRCLFDVVKLSGTPLSHGRAA